jgi:shikimate kinase
MKKHLFLIGFMASGKSSIGKHLSTLLNQPFIDTDLLLEERAQQNLKDFMIESGEISFRLLEREVLKEVIDSQQKSVVATGGGLPCFEENTQLLIENGILIFIDTPEEVLFNRLLNDDSRPLIENLNETELKKYISVKLAERRPFYEEATIKISGDKSINEICTEINEKLELLKS